MERQIQIGPVATLLDLNTEGGHAHVTGIVTANGNFEYALISPEDVKNGNIKYLISVNNTAEVTRLSLDQGYSMAVRSDKPLAGTFKKTYVYKALDKKKTNYAPLIWGILILLVFFLVVKRKH